MIEIAAARLFAAYMSGFDVEDDFDDPIVMNMHEHSCGLSDLLTQDARDAWELYLEMIAGERPSWLHATTRNLALMRLH